MEEQAERVSVIAPNSADGGFVGHADDRQVTVTDVEPFVHLQAILASLPRYAVPSPDFRACGPAEVLTACHGARPRASAAQQTAEDMCVARVERALQQACVDYPVQREVLSRLEVVHASLDACCFADHEEQRLFTAARGTDRVVNPLTFPRDWSNNLSVLLGRVPPRHVQAGDDYLSVKEYFPAYTSYGTGHSLGASVILHVAKHVEDYELKSAPEPPIMARFARIDVFNAAVSPFAGLPPTLQDVDLHLHRTDGDWASWALVRGRNGNLPGQLHTHPVNPRAKDLHALTNFLPNQAATQDSVVAQQDCIDGPSAEKGWLPKWVGMLSAMNCVGARRKGPLGDSFGPRMEKRSIPSTSPTFPARSSVCGVDDDHSASAAPVGTDGLRGHRISAEAADGEDDMHEDLDDLVKPAECSLGRCDANDRRHS